MIDRDQLVLPLGALAVAFLAVLVLGGVYGAQRPAAEVVPVPAPAATSPPPSPTPAPDTTAAIPTAAPAPSPAQQSPAALPVEQHVTLQLKGDQQLVSAVLTAKLWVTVNGNSPLPVTRNPTSLLVTEPPTTLCLRTTKPVRFSINGDNGQPGDPTGVCFDHLPQGGPVNVLVTK